MKRLVCEACGGNEFVKQDGYFVCQHCRSKYLPAEAQKLLVEIDQGTNASNYLRLALQSLYYGDYKEATHYANRALEIDASAKEAWRIKEAAGYLDAAARSYNRFLLDPISAPNFGAGVSVGIGILGLLIVCTAPIGRLISIIGGFIFIAIAVYLSLWYFRSNISEKSRKEAKEYAKMVLQLYPDLPPALEIVNYKAGGKGAFADKVRRDYASRPSTNQQNVLPYGWDGSDPDYDYNYDYGTKRHK